MIVFQNWWAPKFEAGTYQPSSINAGLDKKKWSGQWLVLQVNAGTRVVSMCGHISCIVWYLRYERHQESVKGVRNLTTALEDASDTPEVIDDSDSNDGYDNIVLEEWMKRSRKIIYVRERERERERENTCINWLDSFTPYRQYFSQVTAATIS